MRELNEVQGGRNEANNLNRPNVRENPEKEKKKLYIVGGITLGILLLSIIFERILRINVIERYTIQGYKKKINALHDPENKEIEQVFNKTLSNLVEEDNKLQQNLIDFFKLYQADFGHSEFVQNKIHEIESLKDSPLTKPITKFNILLVSKTPTNLVNSVLNLPDNQTQNISHDYDDLEKHKKFSEKCESITIYDCQDIGFTTKKDGDLKDLCKEIEKRENDDDPNSLINALWYYINGDEYVPPELEVIKNFAKILESRKTNIIVVYENSKEDPHQGRINFFKIKNALMNITNARLVPNFNEDNEGQGNEDHIKFYRKLLKMTFDHIKDMYLGAYSQATLGSLINRFEIFSENIQFDKKLLENNFNKFSGELAKYFNVSSTKFKSKLSFDFYFNQLVNANLDEHTLNWVDFICKEELRHDNCVKEDEKYKQIFEIVKKKVKKENELKVPIHRLVLKKMKKDIIQSISKTLESDKVAFTEPISKEIKDKLTDIVGKSIQKVKVCFNELGYGF